IWKPRCWNGKKQNLRRNCSATTFASASKMECAGKFCRQSYGWQTAARSTGPEIALRELQMLPLFPDIYCGFQTNSISGYWPFLLTLIHSEFKTNKTQTNLHIITVKRTFYEEKGKKKNGPKKIICKTRHCQEDNRPGCLSSGSRRKTHLQSR